MELVRERAHRPRGGGAISDKAQQGKQVAWPHTTFHCLAYQYTIQERVWVTNRPRAARPTLQERRQRVVRSVVASLIDAARARGFVVETMTADKAYDIERVYAECMERDCQPIIPLRRTGAVRRGDLLPPSCEHGPWRFAGSDYRRGAAKWRCPTGACSPASTWRPASRLHPLIPRETLRFGGLYRRRSAGEREFGRLKHEWGLLPLRVRGRDRVALHADLSILGKLATTLERARALSAARIAARGELRPARASRGCE